MKIRFVLCMLTIFALSCGEAQNGDNNGDGNNGANNGANNGGNNGANNGVNNEKASQAEIRQCRQACNQLKFFSCNDAVDHATCFQNCDEAAPSKIEVFAACVSADICDAECSVHIKPAQPIKPVVEDDCVSLCGDFIGESCFPGATVAQCPGACAQEKALVTYCLSNRNACELPEGCSIAPPSPAEECKKGCEQLGFFSCISPTETSDCSSRCDSASTTLAEQFTTCARTGICDDNSCYQLLNPDAGDSTDVDGCQDACDSNKRFDCIGAAEQSSCRTLCETATGSSIETFKSCSQGICDDDSCYLVFDSAN